MTTAGSWPWWLTFSGPVVRSIRATAESGTSLPVTDRRYSLASPVSSRWSSGSASRITG